MESGNGNAYTGELKFSTQVGAEQNRAFEAPATAEGQGEALPLMKFYMNTGQPN